MRFFISPSQCIPVRQPRGDTATHEGHRRVANVAMKWGREGWRPGGRGRETFLITSRRYRLCLSPQLLAISCQIFPACHWTALRTHHPPTPPCYPFASVVVVSTELLSIVTVLRLRYDRRICMISPTEFSI